MPLDAGDAENTPMSTRNREEGRAQYSNKTEYMLSLIGYAVGLGNVWRFPYLAYTNGGGAFLIPYLLALFCLGLPLFVLELGLGQMYRQGCLGVWKKMGLPRMQAVGIASTICTYLVSLYYNVVLAWTLYYLGRTIMSLPSGSLPWGHDAPGFKCPAQVLYPKASLVDNPFIVNLKTGAFNTSHAADFWCPVNVFQNQPSIPDGFASKTLAPSSCPAQAALQFWDLQVLWRSSGIDIVGDLHWGMVAAYTVAWLLVFLCVFAGVASSGKVVYVTATLPYIALVAFFVRAISLDNAVVGLKFFLTPDFSLLLDVRVWLRAVTQIFYSLGVGFGSLIAFASYGKDQKSDFVGDALKVSFINCGTSIFAGFVVFPVLGYVAGELATVNPCVSSDSLSNLSSVVSGTGLAFIAFPIAISLMPGGFFWAFLFFIMLLCLGIDSQFATVESVVTVLEDAGLRGNIPKPLFVALLCLASNVLGLIFVTRGGIYWFELFDNYSTVVAMFSVTCLECIGLMWCNRMEIWPQFRHEVLKLTGRNIGFLLLPWRFLCPLLLALLTALSFSEWDLLGAKHSGRYPESGTGFFPMWSVRVGWVLALLPIWGLLVGAVFLKRSEEVGDVEEGE